MSSVAPAGERHETPAVISTMLRRRTSSEKLYWRLSRPRAPYYLRAAIRVITFRVAAAVAAVIAITLCAFLGAVAGGIGNPRWPSLKSIRGQTIGLAEVHAADGLSSWAPAFVVLGVILVCIPHAHRWMFRILLLGAAGFGYYQRRIPSFSRSVVATDISHRVALLAQSIPQKVPPSSISDAVGIWAAVAIVAIAFYRYSYSLTARTEGLIPRRPMRHYHSAFSGVSVTRRLVAAAVAAVLLSVSFWTADSIRVSLPGVHYGTYFFGEARPSLAGWLLLTCAVALIICMPHPQGFQRLMVVLLVAITCYPFAPRVDMLRIPSWIPANPASFWALVSFYLLVTGLGFELVAAFLDWPG